MLFNSFAFLFLFLPATCAGYLLVGRLRSRRASLAWLVACSIAFYGIWNPMNLVVIFPSIGFNFLIALAIKRQLEREDAGQRLASLLLFVGVAFNLLFLGYFKYKNFFLQATNDLVGTDFAISPVLLPLGISFITFQKIAFLVDVRSRTVVDFDIYDYLTFVFFFPQLIAGPIVHYREMMPQFGQIKYRFEPRDVAVGICLFSMGLFKKVVFADGVSAFVGPVFSAADRGETIGFLAAWMGALAFLFQIYFDFSGYSDMATGLARLFGIRLPVNFNSPLKSSSIIEFWSRWHITFVRFITAYIYMPVVMYLTRARTRLGKSVLTAKAPEPGAFASLVVAPTLFTMLLSGLWHGAGYTFLLWGLMHGVYLCVNHAWRYWRPKWDKAAYERVMRPLGFVLTFGAVVVATVLFRAHSVTAAGHILHGMLGAGGLTLPATLIGDLGALGRVLGALGVAGDASSAGQFVTASVWLAALFLVTTLAPNSLDILRDDDPALHYKPAKAKLRSGENRQPSAPSGWAGAQALKLQWNPMWAIATGVSFALGIFGLTRVSEFIYWQF